MIMDIFVSLRNDSEITRRTRANYLNVIPTALFCCWSINLQVLRDRFFLATTKVSIQS